MAHMTRTHARVCLFGFGWYCSPSRGSNCPKKQFLGRVNRHFPAKRVKYWNVHIIKTTASIIAKFYRVIQTHNYSLWVVQICPKGIQVGGRPPSWKIEKILISSQPIGRFWQNLARWCVSTLSTRMTNKISQFQKPRWRRQPFWKFEKSQ